MPLKTRIYDLYPVFYESLNELASAMGISVSLVSLVKDNKRSINEKFIMGAIKAFPGLTLGELFYAERENQKEGIITAEQWRKKSKRGEVCGILGCTNNPVKECLHCGYHYCTYHTFVILSLAHGVNITPIGKIVRQRRMLAGMSLKELGAMSGISAYHLGCMERGERFPSARVLRRITKHLSFSEEEHFILTEYPYPSLPAWLRLARSILVGS